MLMFWCNGYDFETKNIIKTITAYIKSEKVITSTIYFPSYKSNSNFVCVIEHLFSVFIQQRKQEDNLYLITSIYLPNSSRSLRFHL